MSPAITATSRTSLPAAPPPSRTVPAPSRTVPAPSRTVPAPRDPAPPVDPVARARAAGITAVWTGNYSGTVELARLAGPHDGAITAPDRCRFRLVGLPPWRLSDPQVREVLYQQCLTSGTQFDIYRWINLVDLAAVWHHLRLPAGVRSEWGTVLLAAGLLPSN